MKALYVCAVLAFALCGPSALAQISGNVGVQSDYIWRGATQTDGDPGFFADIEAAWENGFYIGAWTGNVLELGSDMEYELDGWLGWQKESESGFRYGLGYIYYYFTIDEEPGEDLNFGELYGMLGYRWLEVSYSHDPDSDNNYFEANLSFDLPHELTLGFHAGHYTYQPQGEDSLVETDDADDLAIDLTRSWGHLVTKLGYTWIDWAGEKDHGVLAVVNWHWGE